MALFSIPLCFFSFSFSWRSLGLSAFPVSFARALYVFRRKKLFMQNILYELVIAISVYSSACLFQLSISPLSPIWSTFLSLALKGRHTSAMGVAHRNRSQQPHRVAAKDGVFLFAFILRLNCDSWDEWDGHDWFLFFFKT